MLEILPLRLYKSQQKLAPAVLQYIAEDKKRNKIILYQRISYYGIYS